MATALLTNQRKVAPEDDCWPHGILGHPKEIEDDTVTTYERASRHQEATLQSRAFFLKAYREELRGLGGEEQVICGG